MFFDKKASSQPWTAVEKILLILFLAEKSIQERLELRKAMAAHQSFSPLHALFFYVK